MQNFHSPVWCRLVYRTVVLITLLVLLLPVLAIAAFEVELRPVSVVKVSGTLVKHDGVTPIARQTIFIADFSSISLQNPNIIGSERTADSTIHFRSYPKKYPVSDQQSVSAISACMAPKTPYLSYTCSNEKGEFTLQFSAKTTQVSQLTIGRHALRLKIDTTQAHSNLGFIRVNDRENQRTDTIAIVSIALPSSTLHLNTANNNVVTYLLDNEILSAYGINSVQNNIEYHSSFMRDSDGKSILDVARFSTILVKGSWREMSHHLDKNTIKLMLDYVENGGRLLFKGNRIGSSQDSKNLSFI